MSDAKGQLLAPYKMTITNTCTIDANTFIYLHNLLSSSIDSKHIKLRLKDNKDIDVGPLLVSELTKEINDNFNAALNSKINNIKESYMLTNFNLKSGDSITLELQLWLDIDAPNSVMGNMYESAVSVFATTNE